LDAEARLRRAEHALLESASLTPEGQPIGSERRSCGSPLADANAVEQCNVFGARADEKWTRKWRRSESGTIRAQHRPSRRLERKQAIAVIACIEAAVGRWGRTIHAIEKAPRRWIAIRNRSASLVEWA
jgi:hypothetical protein